MLTTIEKILLLQDVPLLRELPTDALAHLAALSHEHEATEGENLWSGGDPADAVWFLLQGALSISDDSGAVHAISPLSDVGTAALVCGSAERATTATVVRPAMLLKLSRDDFFEVLDEHPETARALLGALGTRLCDTLHRLDVGETALA
jgi:CRP-like cAMP-binding protein